MGRYSEPRAIALVAAIQFVAIVAFMIVMPLGPDFAHELGIPVSELGWIAGSYTLTAAASGLIGSFVFDRFGRRAALFAAMLGFSAACALCALAINMSTLVAARALCGLFGGPMAAISLAVVGDLIPPERRGRAMGWTMMSFSLASVLGVPVGLELAHLGNWQTPFLAIALLGLLTALATRFGLPALRGHLERPAGSAPIPSRWMFLERTALLAFCCTASLTISAFLLIPNIAAYLQINLGLPRAYLGLYYMVGGVGSIFALRLAGRMIDKFGSARVLTVSTSFFVVILYVGFVAYDPRLPLIVIFVAFMLAMSARNVALQTMATKVPPPPLRAGFLAANSTVTYLSMGLGALLSTQLMYTRADGTLGGIEVVAVFAMMLSAIGPIFAYFVEHRLARAAPPTAAMPPAAP
jgi:predicted MFS family arabinose efflux permease